MHPEGEVDLAAAHVSGNPVLAYLRVGEIAAEASYREKAVADGLKLWERNVIWNSDILELSDTRWGDLLVDHVALERRFDGFLLESP